MTSPAERAAEAERLIAEKLHAIAVGGHVPGAYSRLAKEALSLLPILRQERDAAAREAEALRAGAEEYAEAEFWRGQDAACETPAQPSADNAIPPMSPSARDRVYDGTPRELTAPEAVALIEEAYRDGWNASRVLASPAQPSADDVERARADENNALTLIGYAVAEAKEHALGPETMLLHWRVERALRTRIAAALAAARAQEREKAAQIADAVQERAAINAQEFKDRYPSMNLDRLREVDNRMAGQRHAATEIATAIRALPDDTGDQA